MLRWAGNDPDRWASLLDPVPAVSTERIEALVGSFEQLDAALWSADQVDRLRKSVRRILHRARTIEGYDSHLSVEQLFRLEAGYHRLEPTDPVRRIAWLFSRQPELLNVTGNDWQAEDRDRDHARTAALVEVVEIAGPDIVLQLAENVEDPFMVGWHASGLIWTDQDVARILVQFLGGADSLRHAGYGMVSSFFHSRGWPWVEQVFSTHAMTDISTDVVVRFACALPFGTPTWDWV